MWVLNSGSKSLCIDFANANFSLYPVMWLLWCWIQGVSHIICIDSLLIDFANINTLLCDCCVWVLMLNSGGKSLCNLYSLTLISLYTLLCDCVWVLNPGGKSLCNLSLTSHYYFSIQLTFLVAFTMSTTRVLVVNLACKLRVMRISQHKFLLIPCYNLY